MRSSARHLLYLQCPQRTAPSSVQTGLSFCRKAFGTARNTNQLRRPSPPRRTSLNSRCCGFYACGCLLRAVRVSSHVVPFYHRALLAVSDEIHQIFVPGRRVSAYRHLVDCSGVILGIAAYTVLVLLFICYFKKSREEKTWLNYPSALK